MTAFTVELSRAKNTTDAIDCRGGKKLDRSLTKAERKEHNFKPEQLDQLRIGARLGVAEGVVTAISGRLGQPLALDPKNFEEAYDRERALPYPLLRNANAEQIARFEEGYTNGLGMPTSSWNPRAVIPYGMAAAHVLGYLRHDDSSEAGEDAFFNYRLPDYSGASGVEGNFDVDLHGRRRSGIRAGKNSQGYRQSEDIGSPPEPGYNVVLTVDLDIQRAAEESLARHQGTNAHAAVVVMDVRSGDVLAMVSSPAFDPNDFAQGISAEKWQQMQESTAEKNRATFENYAPGSIFKTVVGLAALENGLNPNEVYHVQANPERPDKGCIYIGRRKIDDTAPPGDYNFQRAFIHSSNSYFITNGLQAGVENIIRMGEEFHLGERTGLFAQPGNPGVVSLPQPGERAMTGTMGIRPTFALARAKLR